MNYVTPSFVAQLFSFIEEIDNEYKQKHRKNSGRCADKAFSIVGSSNVHLATGGCAASI
jgi:hypothetical protein